MKLSANGLLGHKPCPTCSKDMHRQSRMCQECWKESHARPDNYVTRRCKQCNRDFTVHISRIARGRAVYCSRKCARSGSPTRKKSTPIVTCLNCGKEFRKYKSEIKKTKNGRHFCSHQCYYQYNHKDHHCQWKGGQHERMNPQSSEWRRAVISRDKGLCRRCLGTSRLEAHHIRPFSTHPELRWEVSNGLTLCHNCHVLFRHREMEYAEILSVIASVELLILDGSGFQSQSYRKTSSTSSSRRIESSRKTMRQFRFEWD